MGSKEAGIFGQKEGRFSRNWGEGRGEMGRKGRVEKGDGRGVGKN